MKTTSLLLILAMILTEGCRNTGHENAQTVNAILGDASFVNRYGYAPGKNTNEVLRIKTHLEYVEGLLRASDPSGLTAPQQQKRNQILDLLQRYRIAGVFPANYDYESQRIPCFIDSEGKICAVGYLIEKTAGREVAEQINRSHKYEKILAMNDPAVDDWIHSSGLTKMECAMIQPAYGWYPPPATSPVTYNHITPEYGIASSILGGMSLSLNVLNGVQISGNSNNVTVPAVGLLTGILQVVLGVSQMPEEVKNSAGDYTTNESQKTLSFVNIGLGTSTILLSSWNLFDNRTTRPKRVSWNIQGFPTDQNKLGLGFYYARKF